MTRELEKLLAQEWAKPQELEKATILQVDIQKTQEELFLIP